MSFTFQSDALPDGARVVGLRGREAISAPYQWKVFLVVTGQQAANLDLDAVIGARATLTLESPDISDTTANYRGVLIETELLQALEDSALVSVVLAPALHQLTLNHHSRMFTDTAAPDVIRSVIEERSLDSELRIESQADHPVEEHICQYHESDHAFVSRWIEREGMHYYFDHSGNVEALVISDAANAHDTCLSAAVPYHPLEGKDTSSSEAVHAWTAVSSLLAGDVLLNDYDHLNPSFHVTAEALVSDIGSARVVDHEERLFDADQALRIVEIRAQELAADERVFEGEAAVLGLRAGFTFELEGHPHDELNQSYLIVSIEHEGAQMLGDGPFRKLSGIALDEGYRCRIHAIEASTPYRTPRRTPWPRVAGYVLGKVDGEADSDYAQLDEHGRYKIHLMLDESDLPDGSRSTRIRMMQPHDGAPEGWHFPLRKDTEVVVTFQGGDCDRPLIAGAVPNAETPSVVTEANHTQNVLQTGGRTRLEIEDDEGKQYIYNYTPPKNSFLHLGEPFDGSQNSPSHNIVLNTQGDNLFDVGSNQDITVGGELDEKVKKEVDETYNAKQTSTINGKKETKVGAEVKEYYNNTQTTTVEGGLTDEKYKNGQTSLVKGHRKETYNNGQTTLVFKGSQEFWKGTYERMVLGSTLEYHDGTLTEICKAKVTETSPMTVTETYGDTLAKYDDTYWASPTIDYTGPTIDIITPEEVHYERFYNGCKWINYKYWDYDKKLTTALFIEIFGAMVEVYGLKLDMYAVAIDNTGKQWEGGAVFIAPKAIIDAAVGGQHGHH